MDGTLELGRIISWLEHNNGYNGTTKTFKDFPEIIAQKAVKLTYGQGIIFNSYQKEIIDILNKFRRETNFDLKFRKLIYTASKYGKGIGYLNVSINGQLNFSYVKNLLNARIGTVDEEEQVAEIWTTNYVGDLPLFNKITFEKDIIKVEKFTDDNKAAVGTARTEISPSLRLIESHIFKSTIGGMPFIEIENLPVNNYFNSTYGNFRPDWLPVMRLIELYNEVVRISAVELVANRTRYFGQLEPGQLKKLQEFNAQHQMNGFNDIMGDAYINTNFSTAYAANTTNAGLTVVQGNPVLQLYALYQQFLDEQIMNGSGYTAQKSGESNQYQNKTTSLYADKNDKETTDYKQSLYKEKMYKIFDMVLLYYDKNPYDESGNRIYSFEFINSSIVDTTQLIDEQSKLLEDGIISQAEYRSVIKNIPVKVSEKEIQNIRKDILEWGEIQTEMENTDDEGRQEGDRARPIRQTENKGDKL